MQYLYENQGIEFDGVRADIVRYFGPGHSVTIHDGDGCTLLDTIPGFYCGGTVADSRGTILATFAIDYVTDSEGGIDAPRHVVGLHIGPRGQWCSNLADLDAYRQWLEHLATRYSPRPSPLS